jgi:hypothetical protein
MTPDPIIGRRLFVDSIVRPVFADDAGTSMSSTWTATRCYGTWLPPDDADGDAPLVVPVTEAL